MLPVPQQQLQHARLLLTKVALRPLKMQRHSTGQPQLQPAGMQEQPHAGAPIHTNNKTGGKATLSVGAQAPLLYEPSIISPFLGSTDHFTLPRLCADVTGMGLQAQQRPETLPTTRQQSHLVSS